MPIDTPPEIEKRCRAVVKALRAVLVKAGVSCTKPAFGGVDPGGCFSVAPAVSRETIGVFVSADTERDAWGRRTGYNGRIRIKVGRFRPRQFATKGAFDYAKVAAYVASEVARLDESEKRDRVVQANYRRAATIADQLRRTYDARLRRRYPRSDAYKIESAGHNVVITFRFGDFANAASLLERIVGDD